MSSLRVISSMIRPLEVYRVYYALSGISFLNGDTYKVSTWLLDPWLGSQEYKKFLLRTGTLSLC